MTDLATIIARLEAASGGSRELDAEIEHYVEGVVSDPWLTPDYTTSLDSALTLVPEGWQWSASNRAPNPHAGRAVIHNGKLQFGGIGGLTRNPAFHGEETTAATAAIAMCIVCLRATAALRAREAGGV